MPRNINYHFTNERLANMSNQEIRNLIKNLNSLFHSANNTIKTPNRYNRTAVPNKINKLEKVLTNRERSRQRQAENNRRYRASVRGKVHAAAGAVGRGIGHGLGKAAEALKPFYNAGLLGSGGARIGFTRIKNNPQMMNYIGNVYKTGNYKNYFKNTGPRGGAGIVPLGPNFKPLFPQKRT